MDSTTLRATQAPLKERYRSEPEAALVTLKAAGRIDSANIVCKVLRLAERVPQSLKVAPQIETAMVRRSA